MSGAILLFVVAVALPLAVLEARRKLRDWRGDRSGNRVWVGLDLASGKDICVVHDGTTYRVVDPSSFGTIGELSE